MKPTEFWKKKRKDQADGSSDGKKRETERTPRLRIAIQATARPPPKKTLAAENASSPLCTCGGPVSL
jgi:hypothetical protein